MSELAPPWVLLAELTHRCPLHCAYCSNSLKLTGRDLELDTAEWVRVFTQAAELGIVQLQLSGGEPLLREDLDALIGAARELELFVQVLTSGIGLDRRRAEALARTGVDWIQLSIQSAAASSGDRIAGFKAHAHKRDAASALVEAGLGFTLNVVLHRRNIDELEAIAELALDWGAQRLELANAQYYNWALANRSALLPRASQLQRAERVLEELREELAGKLELVWVLPDYYERRPKPCMGGWGRVSMTVAPDGRALPCPVADTIESLALDSVRTRTLSWIWEHSPAFAAYRGIDWMRSPCRDCPRREIDFGGCRCQAFALTGDAVRADPVCDLSPDRVLIDDALAAAGATSDIRLVYRH